MTAQGVRPAEGHPDRRIPSPEVFLAEGRRIVEEAQRAGAIMRVMGPLALHYRFPGTSTSTRASSAWASVTSPTSTSPPTAGRDKVMSTMKALGYECDLDTMIASGTTGVYFDDAVPMIDVFFDQLEYCHTIDYAGRLELDPYSVSLTDILLQTPSRSRSHDKASASVPVQPALRSATTTTSRVNVRLRRPRLADDWGFFVSATTISPACAGTWTACRALRGAARTSRSRRHADRLGRTSRPSQRAKGWAKRAKKGTSKVWLTKASPIGS